MPSLKILICGGGCAGPALAYWLASCGHKVTIIERFHVLRASGAQIDLRAQGIEVVRRMGLLGAVRSRSVDEMGVAFVNSHDKVQGTILANKSGKGAQSLTSDYEIMRGDLVRLLYDATKEDVEYMFGKTVESFDQDEHSVFVRFSDGSSDTFDLIVGADGQGSRIRKTILSSGGPDPYWRIGVILAYWFIPRAETDTNISTAYHSSGGRVLFRRSHTSTESQAYIALRDSSEELRSIPKAPIEKQKQFIAQRFRDAGWEADRFLKGLETTQSFYCEEALQVRTDTWHKGRVVLVGDAGYCPSPFTGLGTTVALVGAYVLAGEISQHAGNLPQAFANYDRKLRPFVNYVQELNRSFMPYYLPHSQWGVNFFHFVVWLMCVLRIPELITRFSNPDIQGWDLPSYPELDRRTDV
ncbi:oxidoreductase [Nannizzia gypsea CBS 118893]|uniref:Oxidoreductase n=1 Tax=Arthroderma gypseum (strain ATCC MYA-4604 / CBS 118893) TaxID=535722 RepID=E5R2P8_ARTGP|nr:oxidoreductase [Nannizzia gypsea CBS 118893]EFQ97032.1 oxidoreductase [Nannizzia gypsea CBS 118893]